MGSRFNEGQQIIFGRPVYGPAISSTEAAASSVCIVYPSPCHTPGFVTYTNTPTPRSIWKSIAGGLTLASSSFCCSRWLHRSGCVAETTLITVSCSECGREIFRYQKVGKGRLLHCWKQRISTDNSIHDGDLIKCKCGVAIGRNSGRKINLERGDITSSGTALR